MNFLFRIIDYIIDKVLELIDRYILKKKVDQANIADKSVQEGLKDLQAQLESKKKELEDVDKAAKIKEDDIKSKSDSDVLRID